AVHGGEFGIALRIQHLVAGPGQLQAHEHGQQAADEEEGEAGDDEAQADGGVVHRGQAAAPARRAGPGGVQAPQAPVLAGGPRRAHRGLPARRVPARSASPGGSASSAAKAASTAGGAGGPSAPPAASTQALWASPPRTCTSKAIAACPVPQYSAHWPRTGPSPSARRRRRFTRPGMASTLPPRRGIQKEWITSAPVTRNSTMRPRGSDSTSTDSASTRPSASR